MLQLFLALDASASHTDVLLPVARLIGECSYTVAFQDLGGSVSFWCLHIYRSVCVQIGVRVFYSYCCQCYIG